MRSKFLPEGGGDMGRDFDDLRGQFNRINTTSLEGEARLSTEAQDVWGYNERPRLGVYSKLAERPPGVLGHVTARAPQQVLRLALIFALLDGVLEIRREHLEAALEVWRYCDDSCCHLFGDLIGDPTADTILKALRIRPAGVTRSEMNHGLFQRNKKADEIERALHLLAQNARIWSRRLDRDDRAHQFLRRFEA